MPEAMSFYSDEQNDTVPVLPKGNWMNMSDACNLTNLPSLTTKNLYVPENKCLLLKSQGRKNNMSASPFFSTTCTIQWEQIAFMVKILSEVMEGERGFIPMFPLPSGDLCIRNTYYNIRWSCLGKQIHTTKPTLLQQLHNMSLGDQA